MGTSVLSLPIPCLLLLLSLNSGGILKLANGNADVQWWAQGTWCVAKPSSLPEELTNNINYACDIVDCSMIKDGGPCFSPETMVNHASVAMNLYYQQMGRHFWNCDFNKSGIIATTDPSYDHCKYAFNQLV